MYHINREKNVHEKTRIGSEGLYKLLKPLNFTICLIMMVFMLLTYHKENQFSTTDFLVAGVLYLGAACLMAYLASDGPLNKYVMRSNNKTSSMILLVVYVVAVQMMFTNLTAMPLVHFLVYGSLFGVAVNLDAQYMKRKQEEKSKK